jgi:hypothetical protein
MKTLPFIVIALTLLANTTAYSQTDDFDYMGCHIGREQARKDIKNNKMEYYPTGFSSDWPCNLREYLAQKHFSVKVNLGSCMRQDEFECYNIVIDSFMRAVHNESLNKAVSRKIDSFNKSVPKHELPALYNSLGLYYEDYETEKLYKPAKDVREKWEKECAGFDKD